MPKSLKYVSLVFSLIFIAFASLQYNDPDNLVWIVIYGIAAGISVLFFFNKMNKKILIITLIAYLIGFVYLWPDTYEGISLKNGYVPAIEEVRESFGLLICALSIGIYLISGSVKKWE